MNKPLSGSKHSPSGDDLLDPQKVQQLTPIRAWAWTCERKFRQSWKNGNKWLMHVGPHGGTTHCYTKCFACDECCVSSTWGLGACCKIA